MIVASAAALALAKYGPGLFAHDDEHDLAKWATETVAPVESVDCPKHDHGRATFTCTVTFETGRVATLHALEEPSKTVYFWDPLIVGADNLAATIRPLLSAPWRDAAVDCGHGILDVPAGGIRCTATKYGHTEHVIYSPREGANPIREEP